MPMRVFFKADCQPRHARDKDGKRWDENTPGGKDKPEGRQLETLTIHRDGDELWIQIGRGPGSWYGGAITGNQTLKVWFDGGDGSVLRAQWPGKGVVRPGDPGGQDAAKGPVCNSFEMWRSCCWIKLGGTWYCLPC